MLAAFALAMAGLALASPASAVNPAQVSGTVTSVDSGLPIQGVLVSLLGGVAAYGTSTDAAGLYSFASVDAGTYKIQFAAQGVTTESFVTQWWNNSLVQFYATSEVLNDGDIKSYDAQLATGGKITGTVTGNEGAGDFAINAFLQDPGNPANFLQQTFTMAAGDGTYTLRGMAPGNYHISFGDNDQGPSQTRYSLESWSNLWYPAGDIVTVVGLETVPDIDAELSVPGPVAVSRIAGADRFATSAAVWSDPLDYPDALGGTVYVANGRSFADALGAGPVAALTGSPLMLVEQDSIPAAVRTQLLRIAPAKIVMVGGPAALSVNLQNELGTLIFAPTVSRIQGVDRYDTSRELIRAGFDLLAPVDTLVVATGANFPDALSAGPASATRTNSPLLLVNGLGSSLDFPTLSIISEMDPGSIVIVGGTSVISSAMETALALTGHPVTRVAGADRYATSTAINAYFFTPAASKGYLAVGTGFADALSGAARAGAEKAPLYVTPPTCIPIDDMLAMRTYELLNLYLLGGPAALSADVESLYRC